MGSSAITAIYQGSNLIWTLTTPETPLAWIGNGDDTTARQDVWFNTGVIPNIRGVLRAWYSTSQFTDTQVIAGVFDSVNNPAYHFSIHHPRNATYSIAGILCDGTRIPQSNSSNFKIAGAVYDTRIFAMTGTTYSNSYKRLVTGLSGETSQTFSTNFGNTTYYNQFLNCTPVAPIYMFCRYARNIESPDGLCYGGTRIYQLQIYSSTSYSDLVADFRPYLVNGTPCFKEIIGGTYHYNQGTGTVTYGLSGT